MASPPPDCSCNLYSPFLCSSRSRPRGSSWSSPGLPAAPRRPSTHNRSNDPAGSPRIARPARDTDPSSSSARRCSHSCQTECHRCRLVKEGAAAIASIADACRAWLPGNRHLPYAPRLKTETRRLNMCAHCEIAYCCGRGATDFARNVSRECSRRICGD